MTRPKSNWRWTALNFFAVSVLILVLGRGSTDPNATYTFDPGLASGKWAIRFLLICLAMTPLSRYFNWRGAIKLRKPAGLWAFGFAALHLAIFVANDGGWKWLAFPMQLFIALGLLGMVILLLLAVTSNRWAMRELKKNWKRLHRYVYLASVAVTVHALLAVNASKKIFLRDPGAAVELWVYFGLLIVLLLARTTVVRRALKSIRRLGTRLVNLQFQ